MNLNSAGLAGDNGMHPGQIDTARLQTARVLLVAEAVVRSAFGAALKLQLLHSRNPRGDRNKGMKRKNEFKKICKYLHGSQHAVHLRERAAPSASIAMTIQFKPSNKARIQQVSGAAAMQYNAGPYSFCSCATTAFVLSAMALCAGKGGVMACVESVDAPKAIFGRMDLIGQTHSTELSAEGNTRGRTPPQGQSQDQESQTPGASCCQSGSSHC